MDLKCLNRAYVKNQDPDRNCTIYGIADFRVKTPTVNLIDNSATLGRNTFSFGQPCDSLLTQNNAIRTQIT